MASTVHGCWTTSLGSSGLEHASEFKSEVTEAPQIHRLRTLKMRASGFAFMRDGSLLQQWVWFNQSKAFRVRASVRATIRVHRAAVCATSAQKFSQKDYIGFIFLLLRIICVRKKNGMSCRSSFNLSPEREIFEKRVIHFGSRYKSHCTTSASPQLNVLNKVN
jgi:hypothetical protein